MLNRDKFVGKDLEVNEKVCDTLDVKKNLFCEKELATVLKEIKYNKASDADSVVNEFLTYGGSDVRKTLIKPLYKKGDKSKCHNYRGINLVSVGSKLLSDMILFRLRDAVDKF